MDAQKHKEAEVRELRARLSNLESEHDAAQAEIQCLEERLLAATEGIACECFTVFKKIERPGVGSGIELLHFARVCNEGPITCEGCSEAIDGHLQVLEPPGSDTAG